MPSPAPDNGNYANGMRKILGEISQLAIAPDANVAFLDHLQKEIVAEMRAPLNQAMGGMVDPNAMQAAPLMDPNAPPAGPNVAPPGMNTGGAMQGLTPSGPNMAEISRMLGNQGAVQ